MATNTFVEIDLPEAADLADLTGIEVDLETARNFAQMLKSVFESEKPDWTLVDPLSTAILTRYNRAFVTGVRARLGEEALQMLSGPQREKHLRFRSFRDKHIAHSVNAFEDNQPVARYWIERVKEEGIVSVECNHTRVAGLSSDDVEAVIDLTTVMLAHVKVRLKDEKAKVLEIVRKMPIEEVLAGAKGTRHPDMSSIHKPRSK